MKTERVSQILFLTMTAVALAVYSLSAPASIPWGMEAKMAARLAAGEGGLPAAWHLWGYFVEMFAGRFVALAGVVAAIAAGLLAMMVNRYLGWRVAMAAALVWTFMPWVWNGTTLGTRSVCVASGIVILLWEIERIGYRALQRARDARRSAPAVIGCDVLGAPSSKWNGRIAWGALGAAGLFAVVSVLAHDGRLGEPAGAYARGVIREAGDRIIVLNGVVDEQVLDEVKGKSEEGNSDKEVLSSISGERGPRQEAFMAQVLAEWPEQPNFWVAAEIGPGVFLREASKEYGANFYRMGGRDTTPAGWESRWEEMKPFLVSSDPFVPVMRKVFAYEGNAVANAVQEKAKVEGQEGNLELAWTFYRRIYDEVNPGNFAALINQCEMIRRGYKVSEEERRRVNRQMDDFFADPVRRSHAREIARSSGPVRSDPELIARLEQEARARIAEKVAKGELTELPKSWATLIEWNNEMIASVGRGDREKATCIARAILSNGQWDGFIPANAILGTATAAQGDYAAAEVFFRKATSTTNAVPAVVLNDYAHTLMCLGKLDEAERMARRAVEADKTLRVARRTLGEILDRRRKEKGGRE